MTESTELTSQVNPRWWRPALAGLGLGALWIYAWNIWNGARSEYYASIAMSMSKSWSNLWFGAADPAGTISLDKIPGSYWLPALSVKLFGFSTWAIILPNALATALTAVVVAKTARHWLRPSAALLAGVIFALTPIVAAVARSNQPQSLFVLCLALAGERGVAALQTGSTKRLVAAGLQIAAGFHCYMLQAWALWPALGLAWLVAAPLPRGSRVRSLLIAGLASLGASLIWIVSVTLTPAAGRPYVGGTYANSAWEMVFGYNGLGRFGNSASGSYRSFTPPFSANPAFTRLLNDQLAGQIGWLLPAALVSVVVLFIAMRRGALSTRQRGAVWFAAGWLLVFCVMFSAVAGMHQFYTSALAPAIALLVAAAADFGLQRQGKWAEAATLAVSSVAAGWALLSLSRYAWFGGQLIGIQIAAVVGVAALISLPRSSRWRRIAPLALAVSLLATPAAWAVDSMQRPNSINPVAGAGGGIGGGPGAGPTGPVPNGNNFDGGFGAAGSLTGRGGGGMINGAADLDLVEWLKSKRNGTKYVAAMFGAQAAAPYITATGENYVGIGGFDGSDPAPTLAQVQQWIQIGDLVYFVVGSVGGPGGAGGVGSGGSSQIQSWVADHCSLAADAPGTVYQCRPVTT